MAPITDSIICCESRNTSTHVSNGATSFRWHFPYPNTQFMPRPLICTGQVQVLDFGVCQVHIWNLLVGLKSVAQSVLLYNFHILRISTIPMAQQYFVQYALRNH